MIDFDDSDEANDPANYEGDEPEVVDSDHGWAPFDDPDEAASYADGTWDDDEDSAWDRFWDGVADWLGI